MTRYLEGAHKAQNYDPDQPREADGKFASTGGGGGGGGGKKDTADDRLTRLDARREASIRSAMSFQPGLKRYRYDDSESAYRASIKGARGAELVVRDDGDGFQVSVFHRSSAGLDVTDEGFATSPGQLNKMIARVVRQWSKGRR